MASARARASRWAFVSSLPSFFRRSFLSFSFCFFFSLRSSSSRSCRDKGGGQRSERRLTDEVGQKLKEEVSYLLLPLLLHLLQPLQALLLLPLGSLLLLQTTQHRCQTTSTLRTQLHDYISHNARPPSSWPEPPAWPSLWPCWVPSSSPSPPPSCLPSSSSCLSSSCRPRPRLQEDKKKRR